MFNWIRHLIVYVVILGIIGTIWTLGWAKQQDDVSERGYYPAEEPQLFQRVMQQPDADDSNSPAAPLYEKKPCDATPSASRSLTH